jgi:TonB family protein
MTTTFLNYLLEASVALVVLYAVYELLLKRSLHFRFNRAFILAALGLSVVLPWVELPVEQTLVPALPGFALSEATIPVASPGEVSFWSRLTVSLVLKWLYGLGAAVMFIRLLLQLLNLWRWKHKLPAEEKSGYQLILTNGALPTFSFFRWLFWDNSQPLTEAEETLILAHEQTHMRQWHSADVLVLEVGKILFWFHPAVYAFQKAQRAVHEYLADQVAIQHSSQEIYLKLLTHSFLKKLNLQLAQSFYQSPLKNRMKMLQLSQTAKPTVWKAVASLLVTSLVVLVFACSDKVNSLNVMKTDASGRVVDLSGKPIAGALVIVKGTNTGTTTDFDGSYKLENISRGSVLQIQSSSIGSPIQEVAATTKGDIVYSSEALTSLSTEPFVAVEQMPEFPGGIEGLGKYLSENLKYPKASREKGIYGKVFATFVVLEDGAIVNAEITKGVNDEINAEALRVVQAMPKWTPGRQSGKVVPVRYTLPIAFKLDGSKDDSNSSTAIVSATSQAASKPFVAVEQMPEFPGGMEGLIKHLSDNIKYPKDAREKGISGKVFVSFVVREDGTITDTEVAKGVNPELDAEAVRVVKLMPKWIPGRQSGEDVPVRYSLPINFAL